MMKALRWLIPIAGLITIGLGISTLFRPFSALTTIAIFFGIGIISSGFSEIISFFNVEKAYRSGWKLAGGVLSVIFGIWTIFGIGMFAIVVMLPFIFAGWVMAYGIQGIAEAISKKYVERIDNGVVSMSYERLINKGGLFLGILTTILGFVLIFSPLMSARIVSIMLSTMLVAHGFDTIKNFFFMRKEEKQDITEITVTAEEQGQVLEESENEKKGTLGRFGKKAIALYILSWVVKIAIIVAGVILILY